MNQDDAAGGLRGVRATPSPALLAAVREQYGLGYMASAVDLGGSSNLNLLVCEGERRFVVRVYRPYVTAARLDAIHHVRHALAVDGVPCADVLPTRRGQPWIAHEDRLVEVELYVEHDAQMDTWAHLAVGLPLLGRIHTILHAVETGSDGKHPLFANAIDALDVVDRTQHGVQRMRNWVNSPAPRLAADAEELAHLVTTAAREPPSTLPRQLVHGDFWDNNVLFRRGDVVLVADFDFMGVRARIDDLALTLYFTSMKYAEDPVSDEHLVKLRRLVDTYDSGLREPLSCAERTALPLALARQPLWSIGGWVALLDDEQSACQHAAGSAGALRWGLGIMHQLERWQTAFV